MAIAEAAPRRDKLVGEDQLEAAPAAIHLLTEGRRSVWIDPFRRPAGTCTVAGKAGDPANSS